MSMEEITKDFDLGIWFSQLAYEQWTAVPVSGPRPSARYKHAAVVVDDKLYVHGGSRNGRYLSDFQVFDLKSSSWFSLKLKTEPDLDTVGENGLQEGLPPTSDHCMVRWENKLLVIGGHSKRPSDSMTVWSVDLEKHVCGVIKTSGKPPVARGGHSTTLVGSKLIIFGGEDKSRKLLNDVCVLNLETMTWEVLETTQMPPAPRFDHTTTVHANRYLLLFGGCSHSVFFNDLHLLDLQTNEWSQPEIRGDLVNPRAGHAAVTIGDDWFMVGGGDNRNGCSVTIVFNMSKMAWSALTSVKQRDPLASEGISVSAASIDGEKYLVAFGGYNGKYNDEVFVMKLKPKEIVRPKIFQSPAAAAAAASVTAAYAFAKSDKVDISLDNSQTNGIENNHSVKNNKDNVDALKEEKKALESSLAEVKAENSELREKIDLANNNHAEWSKELLAVQGQLVLERSRCFKLEAQIAEVQKMLESMQSLENEVQLLRRQISTLEQELELKENAKRQGSGGVWRWIGS